MSGSGRDTEIRLSADTSSLDSSMQASAAAAQAAFSEISSSAASSGTAVTASITQMERALRAAQTQYQQFGGAAREAVGQYVTALQAQIQAARDSQSALASLTSGVQANASSYAAVINSLTGLDRVVRSAEQSARTFSQSLLHLGLDQTQESIARMGDRVQTLSGQQFGALINSVAGVRSSFQSASSDGSAFRDNMAALGSGVQTLSGSQLAGLVNSITGVRASFASASSDGTAFRDSMAEIGQSVRTVGTRDFASLIDSVTGVRSSFQSASSDGTAFRTQMDAIGGSVRTLASRDLRSVIDEMNGVGRAMLSARDSARAFAEAERQVGDASAVVYRSLQQNINTSLGLDNSIKSASDSYRVFANQLSTVGDTLRGVDQAAEKTGKSIHGAGVIGSGAIQELTRQTRALMTGNWELLPGETMTLMTRMGQLTPVVYGVIGSLAALSLITVEVIKHFRELREARLGAEIGAAMFNPQVYKADADEFVNTLRALPGVGTKVSGEIAETFVSMQGATSANIRYMISTIADLTGGIESRMPAMAQQMRQAFETPATSMREFLGGIDETGISVKRFDQMVGDDANAKRRVLMMETLASTADRVRERTEAAATAARDSARAAAAGSAAAAGGGEFSFGAGPAEAANTAAQAAEVERLANRQRLLAAAVADTTSRVRENAAAGGTWNEKMREGLATAVEAAAQMAQGSGKSGPQMEIVKYEATVEYWKKVLAGDIENNKQRLDAQRSATQANTQLIEAKVRAATAEEATWTQRVTTEIAQRQAQVDISGSRELVSQQQLTQRKLQISVDYWKSILEGGNLTEKQEFLAQHSLATATIGLRASQNATIVSGAKQGLREQLAALSAEQTANKGNYDEVMRIEEQKLSLIRRSVGERSVLYQQELAHKSQLENQGAQEQIQIALRAAQTQASVSRSETTERRAALQEQVATFQISYQEMIATLRQYESVTAGAALQEYDSLVTGLQAGTRAYAQAMDARAKLAANLSRDMQKLATEEAQHDRQTADRKIQIYTQAMSQIGSAVSSSIVGLITKQTTLVGAAQSVARSMLSSFVSLAGEMLARWTALMVAEQLSNQAKNAVIAAQNAGTGSGWSALLSTLLGKFVGAKTAEVAVNTAGNAAKVTSDTAASAASVGAEVAGTVAKKGIALSSIATDAGVAAAGSYAALAGIPIVGPELAEAASAAALAQVSSYAGLVALDVGAYNVPSDMTARIHEGEMVIPRDFASGIRSSLAGDTGGGGGSPAGGDTHLHYSPSFGAAGGSTGTRSIARRSAAEAMRMLQGVVRNGALGLPGRGAVHA